MDFSEAKSGVVTADDRILCILCNILDRNNNRGANFGARIEPQRIEIKGMDEWSIFTVPYTSNFIASNTLKHYGV